MTNWILPAIFAALMITGTAFDLTISIALFRRDNAAALILERFCQLPGYALPLICSAGLLGSVFSFKPHSHLRLLLHTIIALVPLAAGIYTLFSEMRKGAGLGVFPSTAAVILLVVFSFLAFIQENKINPRKVIAVCLTSIFCFFISIAIINLIKNGWGRQRFYSMDDPLLQFTAWYTPQGKASASAFKSFPSGSAAAAALLVWWTMLPDFFEKLKKFKIAIWVIFIAYLGIIMGSRLVLGRHFLSDVTAGAGITIAVFFLLKAIITNFSTLAPFGGAGEA